MTAKRWMRSKPFVGPATLLGTAALSNSRVRSLLNEQEQRTAYLIEGAGTQTIRLAFDDSEIQPTTIKSREGDPSLEETTFRHRGFAASTGRSWSLATGSSCLVSSAQRQPKGRTITTSACLNRALGDLRLPRNNKGWRQSASPLHALLIRI
jgi:hypothetical protein